MSDTLTIDINKVVSKKVTTEMNAMKRQLSEAAQEIFRKDAEIESLKESIILSGGLAEILDDLRANFLQIKSSKTDGGWDNSVSKNQYIYISSVMLTLFGINQEYGGWLSASGGNLKTYLAVNYYSHKKQITRLVSVLCKDHESINNFINNFVMPYDYEKKDILDFLEKLPYCTNGFMFEKSPYWVEAGARKENMPFDLIFKNPLFSDDDVFESVIKAICSKRGQSDLLYFLPKYNPNISIEKIIKMGKLLERKELSALLGSNAVEWFIEKHMFILEESTLEFLSKLATMDNQFKMLHWQKFPPKYQAKILATKSIGEAIKALNDYSCKLSEKEKAALLQAILNTKEQAGQQ